VTGKYFYKNMAKEPSSKCGNRDVQKRLWRISEELTGLI